MYMSWKQTPHKTAAAQFLASHLTNYPCKVNKTWGHCWIIKNKLITGIIFWTPTD